MNILVRALNRFFPGKSRPQGQRFLIVPGPWRLRCWRRIRRWHGVPIFVVSLSCPGPTRHRRLKLGPLRLRVSSSLGKVVAHDEYAKRVA